MNTNKYRILSPDGFDIERDTTYTEKEIDNALQRFVDRYTLQGYYSTGDRERIPLSDIIQNCQLIKI